MAGTSEAEPAGGHEPRTGGRDPGAGTTLRLVVDAANVVGSRPDGWWRDRLGAAERLRDRLAVLADAGLAASELPEGVPTGILTTAGGRVPCEVVMVVEGKARPLADRPAASPRLDVVAAPRDGDETIVARAATLAPPVVVVTADRALRDRVLAAGATIAGPSWLLGLLDAVSDRRPRA